MRAPSLMVCSLALFLGCAEDGTPRDGDEEGAANGGAAGGITITSPPREPSVTDSCSCVPGCPLPEADIERELCEPGGGIITRTTYPGCTDRSYTFSIRDLSSTIHTRDGVLLGCAAISYGMQESSGEGPSPTCDQLEALHCVLCPEQADAQLLEQSKLPLCSQ